jgi:superfamily I DNA and/or RNA helicase
LQSGIQNSAEVLAVLNSTTFPWPRIADAIVPTIFVQCSSEEDMGGRSKSNAGQAELVAHIVPMLTKGPNGENTSLEVTVLSPYTKQVQALKAMSLTCSTIDSFQGRESDIIIFSAVRCNTAGDVGFLDDERRLNVMWTRPKLALIIVGDRKTMETCPLWKRAIESCAEVKIELPSSQT